jgi:hypothetical protein
LHEALFLHPRSLHQWKIREEFKIIDLIDIHQKQRDLKSTITVVSFSTGRT